MSCLEMPRQPVPDFLDGQKRDFNDADTMQPRAAGAIPADARNGGRVKTQDVKPDGVYRPNYNFLTPNMRSPDYVQMSTAAAITLGLMPGKMHRCGCTRCLNLLLTYPEGCRANCAYCGLARHRGPSATTPTATSSASTGRRCRFRRRSTSSRATGRRARSTGCASR